MSERNIMSRDEHISLHKVTAWERAKGELRAMVAAQGQTMGELDKFTVMEDEVESFIKRVEDEEWNS